MTTVELLSTNNSDKEFLEQCEEEFKDRYTERDEEFMKVHNAESAKPPIMETWWVSQNSGRNERRFNRRHHPYDKSNRDNRRSGYDNEYGNDNKQQGFHNRRFNY